MAVVVVMTTRKNSEKNDTRCAHLEVVCVLWAVISGLDGTIFEVPPDIDPNGEQVERSFKTENLIQLEELKTINSSAFFYAEHEFPD